MIGTLSQSQDGIEWVDSLMTSKTGLDGFTNSLLEKFHVFTALYHVSELKSRQDLIALIIQNLDYSMSVDHVLVSYDFSTTTTVTDINVSSSPKRSHQATKTSDSSPHKN